MKTLLKYKILNNKKEAEKTEKKVYVYYFEIKNNLNKKGEIKNDKKYKKEQKKK